MTYHSVTEEMFELLHKSRNVIVMVSSLPKNGNGIPEISLIHSKSSGSEIEEIDDNYCLLVNPTYFRYI